MADGRDGRDGIDGERGPPGPRGPEGPIGAVGPQGPAGADGNDGRDGVDGAQGAPGETGPRGPQGLPGIPGAAGLRGADGADGARGPQGVAGPQGPEGQPGPMPAHRWQGTRLSFQNPDGSFDEPVELRGPAGTNGGGGFGAGDLPFLMDAPKDGDQYARKDGAWVIVSGGGGGSSPAGAEGEVQIKAGSLFGAGGFISEPWALDPDNSTQVRFLKNLNLTVDDPETMGLTFAVGLPVASGAEINIGSSQVLLAAVNTGTGDAAQVVISTGGEATITGTVAVNINGPSVLVNGFSALTKTAGISALTPIPDPSTATAEDCANAINAIISALQA